MNICATRDVLSVNSCLAVIAVDLNLFHIQMSFVALMLRQTILVNIYEDVNTHLRIVRKRGWWEMNSKKWGEGFVGVYSSKRVN